jgi:hypothetical protein
MNIIGKSYWWWMGAGVLAEYQNILDDATSAGITTVPIGALATAQQNLIRAAKDHGWWALDDYLLVMACNNVALAEWATLNWKDASLYRLTETVEGGMVYGVKGYKNVPATGHMNTNFNPATNGVNYTQNAACRG